ncbi:hypothetical protein B0H13DRAFT_2305541 [Mycena leptocephala]|nr:hypothetical protein B0H13DRAFT_2305541 [Mycena leptocephala]
MMSRFTDALQMFKGCLSQREITPLLGKLAFDVLRIFEASPMLLVTEPTLVENFFSSPDTLPRLGHTYVLLHPSDSTSATPGLSTAAPFADVLRTRSEDAPLPHSTKALEAARPPVAPPAYTQKGLGKTNAAGLRNAQDSLAANNGGIPSSSRLLPLSPSRPGVDDGEPLNGLPWALRALGATAPAAGAPVIASHNPATDSLALDRSPTPPVSAPRISTVAHFGMTEYTDPKAETALHMAKRTNKDLHVLADALRVIIEHRLSNLFPSDDLRSTRPRYPSLTQNRSRSPTRGHSRSTTPRRSHSPQPDNQSRSPAHSFHDPIDELYGRVEELEDVGRASREDLTASIAALEEDNSEEGSSAISVKELSVAAARRFTEITSDRNILDSAIKLQAGRLQTINGELHSENKALRKDLDSSRAQHPGAPPQLLAFLPF